MKIKAGIWILGLIFAAVLMVVGCGSSGGSGDAGDGNPDGDVGPSPAFIEKVSGDNQVAPVGASVEEPLVVRVLDENGDPAVGVTVHFSLLSGAANLSDYRAVTDDDGLVGIQAVMSVGLDEVAVRGEVLNVGSVDFRLSPRLPLLGEVLPASYGGIAVADLPVAVVEIDSAGRVLALLTRRGPRLDLSGLTTADDLQGGLIDGTPASDMPVVFLPAFQLVDGSNVTEPIMGELPGAMAVGMPAEEIPVVLVDFLINTRLFIVAVSGDASEIPEVTTLAELLDDNPLVDNKGDLVAASELPLWILDAEDFPSAEAQLDSTFVAPLSDLVPVFNQVLAVLGAPDDPAVPVIEEALSGGGSVLVELEGGEVPATLEILGVEPQWEVCLAAGNIDPIPERCLAAIEVIQDELLPIIEDGSEIREAQIELIGRLIEVMENNADVIQVLLAGETPDLFALMDFAAEALPIVDDILENQLLLMDNVELELLVIRDRLLPAVEQCLPEDGLTFGGHSDDIPSNVADDVLPLVSDEINLFLEAMPLVEELLSDLETLIPGNGDLFTLLINLDRGDLDEVLEDLDALTPYMIESLEMFNDRGIPILYDLLEEAEAEISSGELALGELDEFVAIVEWLSVALPADTILGELPGFVFWEPMIAEYLPEEWGDVADVALFDTLLPAIGELDVAEEVLPALREALDSLAESIPGIISWLEEINWSDIDIGIDFPF